jgi:hypothetical protein
MNVLRVNLCHMADSAHCLLYYSNWRKFTCTCEYSLRLNGLNAQPRGASICTWSSQSHSNPCALQYIKANPSSFLEEHGVLSEQKQGHTMWRGAIDGAIDLGIVELYIDLSMTLIRQRDPWKCAHQVWVELFVISKPRHCWRWLRLSDCQHEEHWLSLYFTVQLCILLRKSAPT